MKKVRLGGGILVIILLFSYLLWPLSSDRFLIKWDQNEIAIKEAYLSHLKAADDSILKPNIILIIADDLGKYDITLYGKGAVNTPHIDQLGADGVKFNQAYTASPVCSPSRAAVLTGRYPQRFGFTYQMHEFYLSNRLQYIGYKYFVDSNPWIPRGIEEIPSVEMASKQGMPPSEITMPEILKKQGYQTALIGKWHLGIDPENTPCNFGFDYQYGFYASHSLYANETKKDIISQRVADDFTDAFIWEGQREGPHAIYRNCSEIQEDMYLTDAITRECKQFIQSNKEKPFFVIASYNAPHSPFQAQKAYADKYADVEDPVKRIYYAMISNLDDAIGDLDAFLQENNLSDNTLIIFISDNGGANYTTATTNLPLNGGKITDFEGGVNIPMIIKWPEKIEAGLTYNNPVITMDIFATIMAQLQVVLPGSRVFDGVNLMPYINGTIDDEPHQFLFWGRGGTKAIRSQNHKMIWNETYKDTLLFSLKDDNYERNNIYSTSGSEINILLKEHQEWMKAMPVPLWPPLINYGYQFDGKTYYFAN